MTMTIANRKANLVVAATCAAILAASAARTIGAQSKSATPQRPPVPTVVVSGAEMYKQYCSACHGPKAMGDGPAAPSLRIPPANLSSLAKRHGGKFPTNYVISVLRFGPGMTAHGSPDMPTWGPLFEVLDKQNERVVDQRLKNLCDYLISLQNPPVQ